MRGRFFRCVALWMSVLIICFAANSSGAEKTDVNVWKNSAEIEIFGKEKIHPGDSHTYTMKLMNPREFYVSFDIYAKAVLTVDGKPDTSTRLPMNITFSNPGADGIKRNVSDLFTEDSLGIHVGHGELSRYNRAYIDVCWEWPFHVSSEIDRLDTLLSRHDTRLKIIITTVSEADPEPFPVPTPEPGADAVIDLTDGNEFIIYDSDYVPVSYSLTEYIHRGSDLRREEGETDEAFAERTLRYQSENPDIFLFEAMPDMTTDEKGAEVPQKDENGMTVFGERKMMLTGPQIEKLLGFGVDEIIFKNGSTALRLEPKALLGGLVAPAFRKLIDAMREHESADAVAVDIVNEKLSGKQLVSVFPAAKVSAAAEDKADEEVSITDLSVFPNSVFEFTVNPVNTGRLLELAVRGSAADRDRRSEVQNLTQDELLLLCGLLKSEKLFKGTSEEFRSALMKDGLISEKRFEELDKKYGGYPVCSIGCRLIYGDEFVDISDLVNAEILTETGYNSLKNAAEASPRPKRGLELENCSYIRFNSGSSADECFEQKETGVRLTALYDEVGPNSDSEFYDVSAGKTYPRLEIKVKKDPENDGVSLVTRSFVSVGFETQPYICCRGKPGGMYMLAKYGT